MSSPPVPYTLAGLETAYRSGRLDPGALVDEAFGRIRETGVPEAWIRLVEVAAAIIAWRNSRAPWSP